MALKEKLMAKIKEEASGVGEYKQLAEEVLTDDSVPNEVRGVLSEIFTSMQADEDKHNKMLRFMVEELL